MKTKTTTHLIICLFLSISFITAKAQYTKLMDFDGAGNGSNSYGTFVSDGTYLYGTTSSGGANNMGTIFKIKPDGTQYQMLHDFSGTADGAGAWGSLITDGTFLYGTTYGGGANNHGVIYKIMPDGSGFVNLFDFSETSSGAESQSSLFYDGTYLYATTSAGGANNMGTVIKVMPDGSGYAKLLDFDGETKGSYSTSALISDGTYLYGMALNGGTNGMGTIFKIMPDGTGFVKLLDFNGTTNGSYPYGSFYYDGTFLYGMTAAGGANSFGTAFKIKPDGSEYQTLVDFAGTSNGKTPYRNTLISDGTYLYGITSEGGTYDLGTLFKVMPNGTGYEKLYDFEGGTNGGGPEGTLISDGTYFYGMTYLGGNNNKGVVFKYQYSGLISISEEANNQANVFPNPFSSHTIIQTEKTLANATLCIYNAQGELVKQQNNLSEQTIKINRENLSAGLYFLKLTEGNKIITSNKLLIIN